MPTSRLLTELSEAVGRQITSVFESSSGIDCGMIALHFTDGTALLLIGAGFDTHEIEVQDTLPYDARQQYDLGLITSEEYNVCVETRVAREAATKQKERRALYERLRAEFEED